MPNCEQRQNSLLNFVLLNIVTALVTSLRILEFKRLFKQLCGLATRLSL